MTDTPTVVGICGTRRAGSVTRTTLEHVADGVRDAGGEFELLDLSELDIPALDPTTDAPEDAEFLTSQIREADAVALGTPLYHASYSSPLKAALDHCGFDEFEDKTVGLVCVSGGSFPTPALNHLRIVCRALNAWVVPNQVAIANSYEAVEDDQLADPDLVERSETLGQKLVEFHDIDPTSRSFQSQENEGA